MRVHRPVGTYEGVPVYDGYSIEPVQHPVVGGHLMLGIGPEGGTPVAYVVLCPTEGVRGLVDELLDVAAPMAEHHGCEHGGASVP